MSAGVEVPQDILERVRALCLALPEVTVRVDYSRTRARSTAHSFDIRQRSFCLLVATEDSTGEPVPLLVLRADPHEREALLSIGHPFFASRAGRDRIGVRLTDDTDWEEIRELVTESYRVLAPKKLTAGLDEQRWPSSPQEQSVSNPATPSADRNGATTARSIIVVSGPGGVGKSTIAHLVAAAFERSMHLDADDLMASVVSGWVDPNLPAAEHQNEAIGGALAVSAMGLAEDGYTTVVSGYLFPDGVAGLAAACRRRALSCHYAVLMADLDTCWERASARGEGRWPLEFEPFAKVHARFSQLDLDDRHVIDAIGSPSAVGEAVLAAFRAGKLAVVRDEQPE